jgi:hypothetical protein
MSAGQNPPPPNELEKLAQARLGLPSLTLAEHSLLRAATGGETADCGEVSPEDRAGNLSSAYSWKSDRQIRAELIRWLCVDRSARQQVDPRGISVVGARILGRLDLSFVTVEFPITLKNCLLEEGVTLKLAHLPTLILDGSRAAGLKAEGVTVAGDLSLAYGFCSRGEVALGDAKVGGDLLCSDGKIVNPARKDVAESGKALTADGITVEGRLALDDGFLAEGEVRLLGARITGTLECRGGTFRNPAQAGAETSGDALSADRVNVGGSIFLDKGIADKGTEVKPFVAEGSVRFLGATTGGNFHFHGAKFENAGQGNGPRDGDALSLDRCTVTGNVVFGAYESDQFTARGSVSLSGARITGVLDLRDSCFGTRLDLTNASAGAIADDDDGKCWPEKGKLVLDGFAYKRISRGARKAAARLKWIDCQDQSFFNPQPYRQLAKVLRDAGDTRGARRVLYEMELRRRMMEGRTRKEEVKEHDSRARPLIWLGGNFLRGLKRFWDEVLRGAIGYGYYPHRAFGWLSALILVGALLFWGGYRTRGMAPTEKEAYAQFECKAPCSTQGSLPEHYAHFHPLIYSMEQSFPLVNLGQRERWEPDPDSAHSTCVRSSIKCFLVRPGFLSWFGWGQIALGWLLATLFALGVTGVVHNE